MADNGTMRKDPEERKEGSNLESDDDDEDMEETEEEKGEQQTVAVRMSVCVTEL